MSPLWLMGLGYGAALLLTVLRHCMGRVQLYSYGTRVARVRYLPRRLWLILIDTFIIGSFVTCALAITYSLALT